MFKLGVLAALVALRSAVGPTTTVAELALLAKLLSCASCDTVAVAILGRLPALAPTAWKIIVTVELIGRVSVAATLLSDTKLVPKMLEPPAAMALTHVMVFRLAGNTSSTVVLVAVCGPGLLITNVNVVVPPTDIAAGLADLAMTTSTCGAHK